MSSNQWPTIPKPLLDKILEVFPPKIYDPKVSVEENLLRSGEARAAQRLKLEYGKQQSSAPIPPL